MPTCILFYNPTPCERNVHITLFLSKLEPTKYDCVAVYGTQFEGKHVSFFCLTFLHVNTTNCRRHTEEFKTSNKVQLHNRREGLCVRTQGTEDVKRQTPVRETVKKKECVDKHS